MTTTRVRILTGAVAVLLVAVIALAAALVLQHGGGGDDNGGRGGRHGGGKGGGKGGGTGGSSSGGSTSTGPQPTASVPTFSPAGTPTADQQALLAQRGGFGGGVTGGAGGTVVHVTTDAESGPGSLRDAVEGDAPKWVVFDQDTTITLTSPLKVGSNTTIDGRGHDVDISGPGTYGIELEQVSNVIIESLTLHDFGDTAKTSQNDLPDAIHLDGSQGVWIDHNDLSMAGDKLVAVSEGSTGVTVSWNHFHDQEQTMQVGNQATADADVKQTVTVDHNFFDRDGYRMPVVSYGRAHVYDNYYLDWRLYAVRAERKGQVYLEDNVFEGDRSTRTILTTPQGDGCNDSHSHCDDSPGYVKAVDNLVENARHVRESDPDNVFDPSQSYQYDAEPATAQLAQQIQDGAGPQS